LGGTVGADVSGSIGTALSGSIGAIGPLTIAGIPSTYHIDVDKLPKIQLGIDPITLNPVDVNLRIKEIPSIRAHLPADFCVGISVLGYELLNVRLCGEAQIITEPYRPNPCEICEEPVLLETNPNADVPGATVTRRGK
jgi:hypothetical protein